MACGSETRSSGSQASRTRAARSGEESREGGGPPTAGQCGIRICGCRDDGKRQWAYDGRPVFTFVKDKQPCDTTGDGMKDVWHVARP
ncbi:hypothetical protein GBW32_33695 [Streptomyces tsukubensis]|uniref:COG4315 family predicted lipoprotein n=1 Tax=Streptomyces tsukubensis TaxID=83656 RepID=UPI00098FBCBE|nr:hypothetical protein GBW32_33695 [Streptomyces tsukubensis]